MPTPASKTFIDQFTRTKTQLSYLNDLDTILRFPAAFPRSEQGLLPPASEYYRTSSRNRSDSHQESILPIIRIASLACDIYENTESIEDRYTTQTIRTMEGRGSRKPSPLGGLDPINSDIMLRIRSMVYDLVSLLAYGIPIAKLWNRVEQGDMEALIDLVRIDKTAFTTPVGAQIVRERHFSADWSFFKKLGAGLAKHPMPDRAYLPIPIVLTARFWDEEFHRWSRSELVDFLVEHDVLPGNQTSYESFRKTLNKVGLKKAKGRPKKGTQA